MPEQVRVLHVMWRMSIGGAERAVFQLVREQRRRGIEADLVVASERGYYGEEAAESGARVHVLGCRSALDVRRSRALTSLASEYKIVHHHGIEPLLIAATSRAHGPKLVYTHRGGVREHGSRKRLRLWLSRNRLRRFSALSGNTRQSAYVLARYLGVPNDEVAVVYNGLDFNLLEPRRHDAEVRAELPEYARSSFLVGTASRLQPLKRVELFLEAISTLPDGIHGLVLGDGPHRSVLERHSLGLGLVNRVTFLGRKENIGDYLQLMDVFALPSGPQEAFGNAAVEAMGVGVPTIVFSDGGGLTEHVTDAVTGRVVDDVASLRSAIDELARSESLRRELGERGRAYVRSTYSLDSMHERYMTVYESALTPSA
jgi:glycosyltransferase involved in cell wall biosynthesis